MAQVRHGNSENKMEKRTLPKRIGQHAYLMRLLVRRNIKNQYYRSFIGILWTVLNPLLNMLVMAFVFSQIFGRGNTGGLDYPLYILSGNIIFGIMRSSTTGSLPCLVSQQDMLQKTKVPISMFPTANVFSSLVTFGFSFIALIIVALFRFAAGEFQFHWEIVLVLVLLPALTLFSLGLSYFLSALYVFFRDLKHIYSVLLTLWTYLTPLFYSPDALKNPAVTEVLKFNPMYHYVTYFRDLLMGNIPSLGEHIVCYAIGIAVFALGALFMLAVRNKIAAKL